MDKMVKVGKFIIGGFVAIIVIGLFMPSTSSTASKPETKSESVVEKITESVWDSQAKLKAESYLSHTSFSRSGLIKQLEFEGFDTVDATQAVNSLNVDWNEQAVLKAKSYLSHSSFSKSGLTQQLEFEGFTPSQAAYGVAHV